jgi:hypothetical protein
MGTPTRPLLDGVRVERLGGSVATVLQRGRVAAMHALSFSTHSAVPACPAAAARL